MLQGMLELVERDAVALWWYTRARRPGIDLSRSRSPYVSDVVDAYAALGRDVWALDLTTDLGIPAVAALSCRSEDGRSVTLGFGAHLDAEVALGRALSELVQMTFGVEAAPRTPTLGRWLAEVTPTDEPWLVAGSDGACAIRRLGRSRGRRPLVRRCDRAGRSRDARRGRRSRRRGSRRQGRRAGAPAASAPVRTGAALRRAARARLDRAAGGEPDPRTRTRSCGRRADRSPARVWHEGRVAAGDPAGSWTSRGVDRRRAGPPSARWLHSLLHRGPAPPSSRRPSTAT